MLATASKPYFQRVSRQLLFLRTPIAGAVYCIAIQTAAGATTATEPAAAGALEEIVVTATRREENINRVPISVTAFSQEMIDQKGIKDFQLHYALNTIKRLAAPVSIASTTPVKKPR